jgi:hypothetical protein
MSDETEKGTGGAAPPEDVPFMQRLLDNPFLLLALGIAVPAILYLVWGVMEVISIPLAS